MRESVRSCSLVSGYALRNVSVVSHAHTLLEMLLLVALFLVIPLELLRCFAEGTLVEMVQLLFSNFSCLKEEEEGSEEECPSNHEPANSKVSM